MRRFSRRPSFALHTLLLLCGCTFVVYQVQELALQQQQGPGRMRMPPPALGAYEIRHEDEEDDGAGISDPEDEVDDVQIWITMGLCWSANTKYHDKGKFPYKAAAPLSAQLWQKMTPAKVILQIVYSEAEPPEDLLEYKSSLEGKGVRVLLAEAKDMKCVLKAQLIRLLAYQLPGVKPNDIVVTADVDAFVMSADIAKPLIYLKHKKMWLYRYELTLNTGYTFMMPFIGARADVWGDILEYDGSLPEMVRKYGHYMNFTEDYTWDIDQHIVSHSILKSGICSVPADNPLWKEVNLEPKPVDDKKTCWHGSGIYEDCNNKLWTRNAMIRYHGKKCKWWHFYPDEREDALESKFAEITSGRSEVGLLNSLVGEAKSFQKSWFGTSLM